MIYLALFKIKAFLNSCRVNRSHDGNDLKTSINNTDDYSEELHCISHNFLGQRVATNH